MTPMFKRNVIKTLLIKGVKMQLMIARIWSIIWSTKYKNGTTDICNAVFCGERGIRTPGTVIPYVSLANWWFQPLTHLT